jgi:hypothetical protein
MFAITLNNIALTEAGRDVRIFSADCPFNKHATIEQIKELLPYPFKLLDGDGVVCFEGFCADTELCAELTLDWAMGFGACVELHYYECGAWRVL